MLTYKWLGILAYSGQPKIGHNQASFLPSFWADQPDSVISPKSEAFVGISPYRIQENVNGDFSNVTDSLGVTPIRNLLLKPDMNFSLGFHEGFVFGRVVKRRICEYNPLRMIDSDGAGIDLAALSAQSSQWIVDPRNQQHDVLYLDKTTGGGWPWFFHGAIGIWPPQVHAYLKFPENGDIPGKFPNVEIIRPALGDRLGYLSSLNSPKDNPTDHVEVVIPPLQHLGIELYNHDAVDAHQPVLGLCFALYFCQIFKPETHGDIIADMANGRRPCKFLCVGFGDNAFVWDTQYGEDWRVKPMTLAQAEAGGRY